MSLINDVLRQVDANTNASTRADIAAVLPAPVAYAPRNNLAGFIFASVSSLLVFVLILQLVSEKSLFSIFENDAQNISVENINEDVAIEVDDKLIAGEVLDSKSTSILEDGVLPENARFSEKTLLLEEVLIPEEKIVAPEIVAPEIVAPEIVAPKISNQNSIKPIKPTKTVASNKSEPVRSIEKVKEKPAVPVVEVNRKSGVSISSQSQVAGEQEYQKSLRFFIDGNLKLSDQYVKQAIQKNDLEKYHSLQARIYIKNKESEKFYALVKSHPSNNSLDWYKLIAPGLQLFSYYQLSNQYYNSLIKVEPEEIRWQLAIALNYLRLEENDKAISTYKKLYESDRVSNKQRQWLIKKIQHLSAGKG